MGLFENNVVITLELLIFLRRSLCVNINHSEIPSQLLISTNTNSTDPLAKDSFDVGPFF